MKRWIGALLAMLCLLMAPSLAEDSFAEWILDVVEGRFILGDVILTLAETDRPIKIGFLHGELLVAVTTPEGEVEFFLGAAQIALTEAAAPYVTEMEFPEDLESEGTICPTCGRSTAIGNHTLLSCGHYGCLMGAGHPQYCGGCHGFRCNGKDHSVCFSCGVHRCVHVDLECEYARNPVPTPMTTKDANGNVKQGWIANDGSAVYGNPNGNMPTWAPAQEYIQQKEMDQMAGGPGPGFGVMEGP